MVNGLETAQEFAETATDDVELIFGGAGTQWIPELEDEDHPHHDRYTSVQDHSAVCEYCAGAFGVEEAVLDSESALREEHDGHPSIRSLVADGS